MREFRNAEEAYGEILANVQGGFQTFFVHVKRDIIPILKEWISAQGGDDQNAWRIRKEMGQQRHILEFGDYTNMARAVMGEFLAREALDGSEARLARATGLARHLPRFKLSPPACRAPCGRAARRLHRRRARADRSR